MTKKVYGEIETEMKILEEKKAELTNVRSEADSKARKAMAKKLVRKVLQHIGEVDAINQQLTPIDARLDELKGIILEEKPLERKEVERLYNEITAEYSARGVNDLVRKKTGELKELLKTIP